MTIPSGTGSELLKSATDFERTSGTFTAIDLTATGIWIGTVLSIVVCNVHATDTMYINMMVNNGSNNVAFVLKQEIPAYGTFVFNDKIVLSDGHTLLIARETAAGTFNTIVSYILQDWT
jgi:hypothetical protein